mmetsp:Transcript_8268/g.11383  ORF Transcript_8268/g.11383 Transcript_8268/m.11383 type:complete len:130 (-) Transcript_8268:137-526(-)
MVGTFGYGALFWTTNPLMMKGKEVVVYKTFEEFYPFYLGEHSDGINRLLHFIGTSLAQLMLIYIVLTGSWSKILFVPLIGYGFAWVGHFFFEKNKPATFKYPFFSLQGDLQMWRDIIRGRVPLFPKKNK